MYTFPGAICLIAIQLAHSLLNPTVFIDKKFSIMKLFLRVARCELGMNTYDAS